MLRSLISLALCILYIAAMWKLFEKAGQPGWAAIIPVYNLYIMLKIGGKPAIWILFCIIPVIDIYFGIVALAAFLKAYGKEGAGPVIIALFFGWIYFPVLAFSADTQYTGNSASV